MPSKNATRITFYIKDEATRDKLNEFAQNAGFKSIGDLSRHLVQEASGIDCTPQHGGNRYKKKDGQ